ncbi:hypothetical protein CBL_03079 [Carabus blaptoides fortunei]
MFMLNVISVLGSMSYQTGWNGVSFTLLNYATFGKAGKRFNFAAYRDYTWESGQQAALLAASVRGRPATPGLVYPSNICALDGCVMHRPLVDISRSEPPALQYVTEGSPTAAAAN